MCGAAPEVSSAYTAVSLCGLIVTDLNEVQVQDLNVDQDQIEDLNVVQDHVHELNVDKDQDLNADQDQDLNVAEDQAEKTNVESLEQSFTAEDSITTR